MTRTENVIATFQSDFRGLIDMVMLKNQEASHGQSCTKSRNVDIDCNIVENNLKTSAKGMRNTKEEQLNGSSEPEDENETFMTMDMYLDKKKMRRLDKKRSNISVTEFLKTAPKRQIIENNHMKDDDPFDVFMFEDNSKSTQIRKESKVSKQQNYPKILKSNSSIYTNNKIRNKKNNSLTYQTSGWVGRDHNNQIGSRSNSSSKTCAQTLSENEIEDLDDTTEDAGQSGLSPIISYSQFECRVKSR